MFTFLTGTPCETANSRIFIYHCIISLLSKYERESTFMKQNPLKYSIEDGLFWGIQEKIKESLKQVISDNCLRNDSSVSVFLIQIHFR
jgi:hypothetical protein